MELKMIDMKKVVANPLQPRQEFNREKLQELANSIKEGELLQPIVVRPNGGNYEIVAGERRYKAFQILKESKIPAIIRDIKDDTDALEKSLIENLQRDDLTSVERENAVGSLWDSGKYKSYNELDRKLGYSPKHSTVSRIIKAREDRKKFATGADISTRVMEHTVGLTDEPRKKLLKSIEEKKIHSRDVEDVVRKVKQFSEPEQQLEILEEFEEQEETSKEIFNGIIQKKKEIVEGTREPEHIVEIESDSDKRALDEYLDVKQKVFGIYADHIQHFSREESKQDAIRIIQDIINYLNKQLKELGVIEEVDFNET